MLINAKKNIKGSDSGFTIIELIVVMTLFLFVIGAAVTIFISIVYHQKRVLFEQQLINQLSYAQEYMSKALRMATAELDEGCMVDSTGTDHEGYVYLLTRYNVATASYGGIKFLNQSNEDSGGVPECQEFYLEKADPACTDGSGSECSLVLKEVKNGGEPVNLISADLKINSAKFIINGDRAQCSGEEPCGANDGPLAVGEANVQPRVTIMLNVKIPDASEPNRIFQTTVSQRNLNAQ